MELGLHPTAFILRGVPSSIDAFVGLCPKEVTVVLTERLQPRMEMRAFNGPERPAAIMRRRAAHVRGTRVFDALRYPGDVSAVAASGRVCAQIDGADPSEHLLQQERLTILEAIDGMPGGFIFLAEGDPIAAARALVEQWGATWAEPELMSKGAGARRDAGRAPASTLLKMGRRWRR